MSLVPFPAPASDAAGALSARSRPSAGATKAIAGVVAGHGHATGRGEHRSGAGRAASPFAQVLNSAHERATANAPGAEARPAGRAARGSDEAAPDEGPDATDDASVIVAVDVESAVAPAVQTPWLLLALGSAPCVRIDQEASESPEPAAVESVPPGGEQAAIIAAPQMPVDVAGAPIAGTAEGLAVGSAADVPVSASVPGEDAGVPAADPAVAAQPGGGDVRNGDALAPTRSRTADPVPLAALTEIDSPAEPVVTMPPQSSGHGGEEVPDASSHGPAASNPIAGALARWHVAARRSGADIASRPAASQIPPQAAGGATRPSGLTAGRLAQAVQTASAQGGTPADAAALPSGAVPGPGAVDAATRSLASGPRDPHASSGSAASIGQLLATPAVVSLPDAGHTSSAAPASPLPPAVGEQVLQQLVSSIRMQWKDGIGEAKLHLRPDALGAVNVVLRVESGAVTAVVRAESAQVQEWVLQHQHTLRQQLENAGLTLDELVVTPDDQRQQAREEPSPDAHQRRPRTARGRRGEDEPQFELLA